MSFWKCQQNCKKVFDEINLNKNKKPSVQGEKQVAKIFPSTTKQSQQIT
ncbi:Uncharacterised protein [Mycoplasmoides pneumoniae]|uniref:Uncharacterized protein n=2 Tax=Mycoplasmoides pneumoniae TaxID=2104 RepID=A0AB38W7S6_MYCPM|nr:hypothetical protein MPNE_0172 [Mycoplasmoides pneumoniae FH]VEU57347.1 Uncharacterised protein [Mycoplasmoides pneumoniae]